MIKTFLKYLNLWISWLTWPFLFLILHNTQRTRLILLSGSKVVLTKPWFSDGKWRLPGGGLERNEPPNLGVVRETKEETGLVIDPGLLKSLGSQEINEKGIRYQAHFFSLIVPSPLPVKPRKEIMKAEWVELAILNDKNTDAETLRALRLYQK